jgi:hypothetical protein
MAGYTQTELDDVQARWQLRFPPDLIAILRERRHVVPDARYNTHDWVADSPDRIRQLLNWPFESFLFDVQHGYWWPEWGPMPADMREREEKFGAIFRSAPKLIPLSGHRLLPEDPCEAGNPVFSVYQMDVVHYGANLSHYIARELRAIEYGAAWPALKRIPFWTTAVEYGEKGYPKGAAESTS